MEDKLPNNWVKTPLGEILIIRKGKKPKSTISENKDGYWPYILISEMEGGQIRFYTNDISVPIAEKNDVLLVWDGSIGKCVSGLYGAIGSTLVSLTPLNNMPARFIEFFIKYKNQYILENSTGTGLQHINKNFFKECIINLPPILEQKRIVLKLDTLFENLAAIKIILNKIPHLLEKTRQATLSQAVEGKLTKEWRKGRVLNGVDLIEIEKERENLKKSLAFEKGRNSYNHVNAVKPELGGRSKGLSEMFDVPSSWRWVSIDQITYNISDGPHFSPKYVAAGEGKRFISMRNISFNKLDFSDCKYISDKDHLEFIKRGKPETGDILYTKGGTTGIPCVLKDDTDFAYWVHVALLKPIKSVINSNYFMNALGSSLCYNQSQALTHGVGNQDLGLTRLTYISFPLPTMEEQTEIVKRTESLFAKINAIEQKYFALKMKIDDLPQAILTKAFNGELVKQLSTDGDAKDLLDDIKKLKIIATDKTKNVPTKLTKKIIHKKAKINSGTNHSLHSILKFHPKGITEEKLYSLSGMTQHTFLIQLDKEIGSELIEMTGGERSLLVCKSKK